MKAITMTVSVLATEDLTETVLADYFPAAWGLVSTDAKPVEPVDGHVKIAWPVGDIVSGTIISRTYELATPALTKPPTSYVFTTTLESPAGRIESGVWRVIVADPTIDPLVAPTGDQFLHATDVIVNGTTFNTVNSTGVAGTLTTANAPLNVRRSATLFSDAAGISIWASDPVPTGKTWTLGNPFSFSVYIKASASNSVRVMFAARIYKIATSGATQLRQTGYTGQYEPLSTSYQLISWSDSGVPSTVLNPGERIGVAFIAYVDNNEQSGLNAVLGFDHSSTPSKVTMTVTESGGSGVAQVVHYRIGNDTPLASMTWKAMTDTVAGPILQGEKLRVRFQLYNDGGAAYSWRPRLEYATSTSGPWSAAPTTSGTAPFYVALTNQFANGDPITAAALGTRVETWQNGVAYESSNPPTTAWDLNADGYTEVEHSVETTSNAVLGTQYYFRLTNNGTALTGYAVYASITMQSSEPPGATPAAPTPTPQNPAHNNSLPYSANTDACAYCHRVHTAVSPEALRKAWPEEQLCYTCHDGTTSAPNIRSQFQKSTHMPIDQTTFVHRKGEERVGSSFGGANRHVECEDCHNPHAAGKVTHSLGVPYAAGPQQGVWGVSAAWSSWWTVPTFSVTNTITFQYELCFKCHSSWAFGGSPPTNPSGGFPATDQALEFNPYNSSYHPVAAVGKNPFQWANGTSYASSLLNGLTPSSNLVCSDCHGSENDSDPKGPHGSANPWILRGHWNRSIGPGSTDALCFKCHDYNRYANRSNRGDPSGTGFTDGSKNLHAAMVGAGNRANGDAPITCMDCHIAIPHGWKRKRLIGLTGDGAPYINRPYSGGLTTINRWAESGTWQFDDCGTAMDSCK